MTAHRTRRILAAAIAAAALVAVANGCGDDDSGQGTDDGTETTADAAEGAVTTLTLRAEGGDPTQVAQASEIVRARLLALDLADFTVEVDGRTIRVHLDADLDDTRRDEVGALLTTAGTLAFRPVLEALPPGETSSAVPGAEVLEERPLPGGDPLAFAVGPVLVDGTAVESATVGESPSNPDEPVVGLVFREGAAGIDAFNAAAALCSATAPECPTGQLGVVFDDVVLAAPRITQPTFVRDQVEITGSLTREQAEELALAVRTGSLPVTLVVT